MAKWELDETRVFLVGVISFINSGLKTNFGGPEYFWFDQPYDLIIESRLTVLDVLQARAASFASSAGPEDLAGEKPGVPRKASPVLDPLSW